MSLSEHSDLQPKSEQRPKDAPPPAVPGELAETGAGDSVLPADDARTPTLAQRGTADGVSNPAAPPTEKGAATGAEGDSAVVGPKGEAAGTPVVAAAGERQTFVPTRTRPENPRRVRDGIKLRDPDKVLLAEGPWVPVWRDLIVGLVDEDERLQSVEYARLGQVATLDLDPGSIMATVQGRSPRPYETVVRIPVIPPSTWESLIQAIAEDASLVAALLAGEFPEGIRDIFASQQAPLIPTSVQASGCTCTCTPDEPAKCRHISAVWILVGNMILQDPSVLLRLRGMGRTRLVDRLRQLRAIHTRGIAAAHVDPLIPESRIVPLPLEECVEGFWATGSQISRVLDVPAEYAQQALLRRLGPSTLNGKFPLVGLLASIYETVAADALKLRNSAEHLDSDESE